MMITSVGSSRRATKRGKCGSRKKRLQNYAFHNPPRKVDLKARRRKQGSTSPAACRTCLGPKRRPRSSSASPFSTCLSRPWRRSFGPSTVGRSESPCESQVESQCERQCENQVESQRENQCESPRSRMHRHRAPARMHPAPAPI
jgi:hypothetical protein